MKGLQQRVAAEQEDEARNQIRAIRRLETADRESIGGEFVRLMGVQVFGLDQRHARCLGQRAVIELTQFDMARLVSSTNKTAVR